MVDTFLSSSKVQLLSAASAGTLISLGFGVAIRRRARRAQNRCGEARVVHPNQLASDCDARTCLNDLCTDLLAPSIAEYLTFVEMATCRSCHRKLRVFDLRDMLSNLSLLGLGGNRTNSLGLSMMLQANACVDYKTVLDAIFNDALRCGGNLDALLSAKDSQGRSLLQIAVQLSCRDAVKALLAVGAAVDYGDTASGWSPLMYAIAIGDQESAKMLVSRGASVNFQARPHRWTPLVVAVAGNHVSMVEWLLDCGADAETTRKKLKSHFSPGQLDVLVRIVERRKSRCVSLTVSAQKGLK